MLRSADNSPPSEAQYGNMQLSRAFDIVFPSSQFKIVGTDEAKMQNLSNQKLKDWGKESESLMASGGVFFPPGTPRARFLSKSVEPAYNPLTSFLYQFKSHSEILYKERIRFLFNFNCFFCLGVIFCEIIYKFYCFHFGLSNFGNGCFAS